MKEKKKVVAPAAKREIVAEKPFSSSHPILWLLAACVALYLPTLNFGFTELDDTIFIRDLSGYNEDISNLITSFKRGVFDAEKDTYYRPLFLDAMILNYQISEDDITGYRVINLLLHMASVLLLFQLLQKLKLDVNTAFLLSLLFAVHPVLSQAVVWIPGRNDTLLAIFVLPYLTAAITYAERQQPVVLLVSFLCLLAAMFTKETALLAPVAAVILLAVMLKKPLMARTQLIQYGTWLVVFGIYFLVRSQATLKQQLMVPEQMIKDFFSRLPVIVQYIGKVILPFNLSVFPIQQDTSIYFGLAALVVLAGLLIAAKGFSKRTVVGGFLLFFTFLLPVLLVPNTLNEQIFEHRLYLPIIGILLMLSQTALFRNKLAAKSQLWIVVSIAAVFSLVNYNHQPNFKDPISFWQQAAKTSPNSAYALMMYGARIEDKQQGYALMRRAYQLNPNEKYLNYYYGVMLQNQDSVLASEKHFRKEQEISDYFECDFYLAQVEFQKGDRPGAQRHLERYLTRDSLNSPANNNLLLLYIDLKNREKALNHISAMQRRGLMVPEALIQQVQGMP